MLTSRWQERRARGATHGGWSSSGEICASFTFYFHLCNGNTGTHFKKKTEHLQHNWFACLNTTMNGVVAFLGFFFNFLVFVTSVNEKGAVLALKQHLNIEVVIASRPFG